MISLKEIENIISNKYVGALLSILAISYGGLIAPDLPLWLAKIINNKVTKIIIIALIIMSKKISPVLAILISLAFIISMQSVNRHSIIQLTNNVIEINKLKNKDVSNKDVSKPNIDVSNNMSYDLSKPNTEQQIINTDVSNIYTSNTSTYNIDTSNVDNFQNNDDFDKGILTKNIPPFPYNSEEVYSTFAWKNNTFDHLNDRLSNADDNDKAHYGQFRSSSTIDELNRY